MGLSTSQGRLLMLTSRINDIELAETMASHRQTLLATKNEEAGRKYTEAMNNTKLQIVYNDQDGKSITEDLTYNNLTANGYLLVDGKGDLYLPKENDQWKKPENLPENVSMTIDEETGEATITYRIPKSSNLVSDDDNTVNEADIDYDTVVKKYKLQDGTAKLTDKNTMQNALIHANLFVINTKDPDAGAIGMNMLEANTEMRYVLDTSDDAKAQAEYDYALAQVKRQENVFEMQIKQLETEHTALTKERESLDSVIKSNIDRTYKLFSKG